VAAAARRYRTGAVTAASPSYFKNHETIAAFAAPVYHHQTAMRDNNVYRRNNNERKRGPIPPVRMGRQCEKNNNER